MSVLVKENPVANRENDHQARIDQRQRAEVGFEFANLHDPMGDYASASARSRCKPSTPGKYEPEHRRLKNGGSRARRAEKKNEQQDEPPATNFATAVYRSNDLTLRVGGVGPTARQAAGAQCRARFGCENGGCVSWLTLSRDAKISLRVNVSGRC